MTLPASGTITWQQICTEFSLNPITAVWPASFYGKGGVPSSGTLSFSHFYGKSAGGTFTPVGGTYSETDNNTSTGGNGASFTITSNSGAVTWTWSRTAGTLGGGNIASGSSASSITFDLAAGIGTGARSSTFSVSAGGVSWTITLNASGTGSPGGGGPLP